VVVAIVGLLAAIALPSYTDYIRKSRRADGIATILNLQLAQEKFRANCIQYAEEIVDIGSEPDPDDDTCKTQNNKFGFEHSPSSSDRHYILEFKDATGAVVTSTATGYTIRATPVSGDDQNNDKCKSFVLTVSGGTDPDKDVSDDATETKERCWQR